MKFKGKNLNWLWLAVLGVMIFLAGRYFFFQPEVLPTEFIDARLRGAKTAQKIVSLSNGSLDSLNQIARQDREGNSSEALILISNQLIQNRDIHKEAIALSSELGKMASNLPVIRPSRAQRIATEAVSYEVALVSRLVGYNEFIRRLFEILEAKFTGKLVDADGQVGTLISQINEEREAINDLDSKFNAAMAELDKIFLK